MLLVTKQVLKTLDERTRILGEALSLQAWSEKGEEYLIEDKIIEFCTPCPEGMGVRWRALVCCCLVSLSI